MNSNTPSGSEARYRLLFESNPHAMWVFDLESLDILAVNDAATHLYGYSRAEFLTMTILDIRPPEDVPAIRAKASRIAANPAGLDVAGVWRHRKRDGSLFDAEVTTHAIRFEGRSARLSLVIDVTERERVTAERGQLVDQLESERARLVAILEQLPVCVIIAEAPSGRIVLGNTQVERILGHSPYDAETVADYTRYGGIHPDGRPFAAEDYPLARAVQTGHPVPVEEMLYQRPDGTRVVLAAGANPVRDGAGTVIAAVLVLEDITERKRAEEKLAWMAALVESSHDAIVGCTLDGTIVAWNRGAERIYGYPAAEAVGHNIAMTVPTEFRHELPPILNAMARGEVLEAIEAERQRRDGSRIHLLIGVSPIWGPTGQIVGASAIAHDRTDRKRTEDHQRFLVDVSTTLASSFDDDATLQTVAELAVSWIADICLVDLLEADGSLRRVAAAHRDPTQTSSAAAIEWHMPRAALPAGHPGRVLVTLRPEISPAVPEGVVSRGENSDRDSRLDLGAVLAIPLLARGRALGILTFISTEAGRVFGDADLPLAEEVARRAGIAVDNARLFTAEQHARAEAEEATRRIARLQAITAALADALTAEEVAVVAVDQGVAALGARAGSIVFPAPDGDGFHVVRSVGYDPAVIDAWRWIPAVPRTPISDAARQQTPIFLGSPEELATAYPKVADQMTATGSKAFTVIPLIVEGRTAAVLSLSFAEPRQFSAADAAYTLAVVRQATQAMERARLHKAERDALARAEAARERLALLAEASAILASSLDAEQTLRRVANLTVPRLADWCWIHIVDEAGLLRQLTIAHRDPAKIDWATETIERFPGDSNAPFGLPQVLQTDYAYLEPEMTDEMLVTAAESSDHLEFLRNVGMRSVMTVPIVVRDRPLGVVCLVSAESERHYGPDDLALVEDLARRCAAALEQARLFDEAREAVRARDEFLSIASHELRTPVTSIKGYAQLLLRSHQRNLLKPERLEQFLRTIDEASDRLGVLTNDLLDVSRIRLGQLPLRPRSLDLAALARNVAERYRVQTEPHRSIEVEIVSEPATVFADPDRTEQILTNLIDNAVKYSPAGGAIGIGVEPREAGVLVSVRDTGIGLRPEDLGSIFAPFNRATNATRDNLPGLGLGLYICRSIAERHGGRIWAESAGEGHGTTMRLLLPTEGNP